MKYVLGLDIGITSVGWSVLNLDDQRIEDLGIRAFNAAENPKDGAPLAEPRRIARGVRRRLRRRAGRLKRIKNLFSESGLIPAEAKLSAFITTANKPDPWQLRADGLNRRLSGEEFARALFHIAKRRGFKSNSKAEKADSDKKEEGKVKDGINANKQRLLNGGYQTVGEMFARDEAFIERKRNRANYYDNTIERAQLEEEVKILFRRQSELFSPYATDTLRDEYLQFFNWQLPFASGDDIIAKVGRCTFEPEEKRAPRCSYSAERFGVLQKINNLSYYLGGDELELTQEQRKLLLDLAHEKKELKFSHVRKALNLPDEAIFPNLKYEKTQDNQLVRSNECEAKNRFYHLPGYHAMKSILPEGYKADADVLDTLAYALTFYKNEEDIRSYLTQAGFDDRIIKAACEHPGFAKVSHLSIKALRKIIPHLEQGLKYHEACEAAGYDHTAQSTNEKQHKLPPIDRDEIRNPVVLRGLSQARKVVNAIISKYGAPHRIHIELARDMSKTYEERKKIDNENKTNNAEREKALEQIKEELGIDEPSGELLMKWRLYHEQNGQCAYTQSGLDLQRLNEPGYAEIDHILPMSRSFDNRRNNKVLVRGDENRNKRDRTPYEYFGHNEERWNKFEGWVNANIRNNKKKINLLMKDFNEKKAEEWKQRSLTDTQYLTRYFGGFLRDHLRFNNADGKQTVTSVNGQLTSIMRGLWGLPKDRGEDDLHHAVDATVVAALLPWQITRITEFRKACETLKANHVDTQTGEILDFGQERKPFMPAPWKGFRKELIARLSDDPASELAQLDLPSYATHPGVRPILVSRMPRRKMSGPIHEDTIRSTRLMKAGNEEGKPKSCVRKPLTSLKPEDLQRLVAPETNEKLYAAIRRRLMEYDNNVKKAFGDPENPLRKPTSDGTLGPIVRSVKLSQAQNVGVTVREGIAENGRMVRVDVFRKDSKFYLVPVYTKDVLAKTLPKQAVKGKVPQDEWPEMDDTYEFRFSLYPNDLVKITTSKGELFGYYKSMNINNGKIVLRRPNGGTTDLETGARNAQDFQKFEVDVLGGYFPVRNEVRRGLEDDTDQQPGQAED